MIGFKNFAGRLCGQNILLEVVDAVARNGSFSAAAQELHRVPSAVSYTVRQLEEWLAVPAF
ncbi:LysR family transcriptional regulator [Escherichia coli]|uniref:LysR family transcriptional regulator n=1 Tax=Escherichia coli TaxID=562 RepID=A0A377K6A1_ECOLX|nr:LysR family transcriptional regulator [Escherichia coli]